MRIRTRSPEMIPILNEGLPVLLYKSLMTPRSPAGISTCIQPFRDSTRGLTTIIRKNVIATAKKPDTTSVSGARNHFLSRRPV
jgi:hypothetical protein